MKMKAYLDKRILVVGDRDIDILCDVRNELNGRRGRNEVVKSIPDGVPIEPRPFPKGIWNVGIPLPRSSDYLRPYFIPTDAWQMLPIWELDSVGGYKKETTEMCRDTGYGLHFSTSRTTQGCIRIVNESDLFWLKDIILEAYRNKEKVTLEVV